MFVPRHKRFLVALLAFGTVGGYAWGFHSMHRFREMHRRAFERHVADVCVDAARRSSVDAGQR